MKNENMYIPVDKRSVSFLLKAFLLILVLAIGNTKVREKATTGKRTVSFQVSMAGFSFDLGIASY